MPTRPPTISTRAGTAVGLTHRPLHQYPTLLLCPGRIASIQLVSLLPQGPALVLLPPRGETAKLPMKTRTILRKKSINSLQEVWIRESSFSRPEKKFDRLNASISRREAVRRQRIESEQKRRDELRDGYARLKSTLPSINQKSSKVTLLDRGKCQSDMLSLNIS